MNIALPRFNSVIAVNGVVSTLLVCSACTMRPSLLGEIMTPASLLFVSIALLFAIVGGLRIDSALLRKNMLIAGTVVVLWAYLVAHSLLMGAEHIDYLLKAIIVIPVLLLTFAWLLSAPEINLRFFRGMVWVFLAMTASYLVTILLSSMGEGLEQLLILHLQSKYYVEQWGGMYFPFTTAYGLIRIGDLTFFRAQGAFREAGIYQAFIVWAYLSLPYLGMNRMWIKVLLIIALAATFSTTGIAVFFTVIWLRLIFIGSSHGQKQGSVRLIFISVIFLTVGGGLLLFSPVMGLLDKSELAGDSISDRSGGTIAGLSDFANQPFGVGIYNQNQQLETVGINLISSLYYIGIIGALLVLLVFCVALLLRYDKNERKLFAMLMFPFWITWLVAQPFIDSPLIFIMLMQWTNLSGMPLWKFNFGPVGK